MKTIQDLNKTLKAYIILHPNKEIAGYVHLRRGSSGAVQADVYEIKDHSRKLVHQRKATGYGYDKETAALSGAVLHGIRLYDHCEKAGEPSGLNCLEKAGFIILDSWI